MLCYACYAGVNVQENIELCCGIFFNSVGYGLKKIHLCLIPNGYLHKAV